MGEQEGDAQESHVISGLDVRSLLHQQAGAADVAGAEGKVKRGDAPFLQWRGGGRVNRDSGGTPAWTREQARRAAKKNESRGGVLFRTLPAGACPAPAASSALTQATRPFPAAHCSGMLPSSSLAVASAPASSSARTQSQWPCPAEMCNGDAP